MLLPASSGFSSTSLANLQGYGPQIVFTLQNKSEWIALLV
jgi:hypothetical protein